MLPQSQKSPVVNYKSRYEVVLGQVLRDAQVPHGFESLEINIDSKNNIRFTPDFASSLRKGGKQVVFEIHSEFNFNVPFIEKMFFVKRIAPEYHYVLISDMPRKEANRRMNAIKSNFEVQNKFVASKGEIKFSLDASRNLFGWGDEGSIFDFTYSELNFKSAYKTLSVDDICDEFWSVPEKKQFKHEYDRHEKFYNAMGASIYLELQNFKESIRHD